ncbi:MAG: glycosyltransferase family 2 protein, partial [Bacteroidota bacterium]
MEKPLLTIAVPTWNRADILDDALSQLLPQIKHHSDRVEIIISDNASDDHTDQIIKKHCSLNSHLNIIHFTQNENTGYFGNFHKCRTLSSGEYFWLLSDNDFIANGLVDYVLEVLIENSPSFVFLRDWEHANKVTGTPKFENKVYPVFRGVEVFNYKTTLISAVV